MEHRTTEVLQEIKADTQFAKLFVEQLGKNSMKAKWHGFDCDHFGHGRESQNGTSGSGHDEDSEERKIQEVS